MDLSFLTQLNPEIIIQGGLTLAVFGLIWLNATSNKRFFNHMSETVENNSKALTDNARTNQRLADSIHELIRHLNK